MNNFTRAIFEVLLVLCFLFIIDVSTDHSEKVVVDVAKQLGVANKEIIKLRSENRDLKKQIIFEELSDGVPCSQ